MNKEQEIELSEKHGISVLDVKYHFDMNFIDWLCEERTMNPKGWIATTMHKGWYKLTDTAKEVILKEYDNYIENFGK